MTAAFPLLPLPVEVKRPAGRGPVLAHCADCKRPIWRAEYAARRKGEKCGGRIRHPRERKVPVPVARKPPDDEVEGQLRLFEVCVVRVAK